MAKLENVKVLEMSYGEVTHIQYNGKIYERVSEKASVGDLVRVKDDEAAGWICSVESGAFYELHEDEYGYLFFKDDDDDARVYSNWSDELELFRAIETADKDIEKQVAELERRLSAIERQSDRLKVGDYARVVGDTCFGDITRNSIVRIASDLNENGDYKIKLLDGSDYDYDYARPSALEKYTEYIDEMERSKFKKGDKVRLVSGGDEYPLWGFYNGKVYEVDDNNCKHGAGPFGKLIRIVEKDGGPGYARPDQLEKVDFEELKFAELGRKPGEFKKGDIVRVIDSCGGRLIKGGLYEISGHKGNTEYVTFDGEAWLAEFELVAPVESRVDLD